jgi:hypothetical protein
MCRGNAFLGVVLAFLALAGGPDFQHSLLEAGDHPVAAQAGTIAAQRLSASALPNAPLPEQASGATLVGARAASPRGSEYCPALRSSPSLLSLGCLLTV